GASLGSFGVLGCTLPRKIPLIRIIEYTNVNILPTIASIGNSTLTSARTLKFASLISNIASKNSSLDKKPLKGGMPAMESDVMRVNVNDTGMMAARPPSFFRLLVPVSWSTMPMIMNSAPLKVAWLIRWNTAATTAIVKICSDAPLCTPKAPMPRSDMMSPSCETVEKASTAFRSSCLTALNAAHTSVMRPTSKILQTHNSEKANNGVNLATRYRPALTIVAECRYALTGVGASMASGSQT